MKKEQGGGKSTRKSVSNRDFMKISLHSQQKKHYDGYEKHSNPLTHEPSVDPYKTSYQSEFKTLSNKESNEHLDTLRKQKDIVSTHDDLCCL